MDTQTLVNALIEVANAIDSGDTNDLRNLIEKIKPPTHIPNMNAATVKYLREVTGLGLMQCKKALLSAQGDVDDAVKLLRSGPPY